MSVTDVETAGKVTAGHLARTAYLYVRQSTLRQVVHNTESATRQYALRQRAIALGWPAEQIVTIDCDQGHSGASAADREGFQRLVAEVGIGRFRRSSRAARRRRAGCGCQRAGRG
jgi:DNA invertase Pin-like site-specific DNA recombinase